MTDVQAGEVLLVDDDPSACGAVGALLEASGFRVRTAADGRQALGVVLDTQVDAVLTDLRMPGMDGLELCRRLREHDRGLPVLLLTGYGDYGVAVEAARAGVFDVLAKPVESAQLTTSLRRATDHGRSHRELRRLSSLPSHVGVVEGMLGESAVLQRLVSQLRQLATLNTPVVLFGEHGSGKKVAARALHQLGARSHAPLSVVSSGLLPAGPQEIELFGDAAVGGADGLLLEADGGTVLLDDVGELPLPVQARLVRFLDDGRVRALGSRADQRSDVRLLFTSDCPLHEAVARGTVRADLADRLGGAELQVPPLRDREDDVVRLAHAFLEEQARKLNKDVVGFGSEALRALRDYGWPGNVRELRLVVETAVALSEHNRVSVRELPQRLLQPASPPEASPSLDAMPSLEEVELRYIREVLDACGGNKSSAARVLGVDRTTLWRRLDRGKKN